ncbi:hypothetical protein KM043_014316 [Ampulex compressa]|nr:hypothetical protein KM043_014316 [Ampulex compressa]
MTHESVEESFESVSETSVPSDRGDGESDEPTVAETRTGTMELRNRAKIKTPKRYGLNLAQYHLPETFQKAMSGLDKKLWTKAIEEELAAHEKNEIWALVKRQAGRLIDSKLVFKVIKDTDEQIVCHKARLCERGFQQQHGLNYRRLLLL